MNSETRMGYGSRVRRQGRSRPWRRNQRRRERRNARGFLSRITISPERPTPNAERPMSNSRVERWTLSVQRWTFATNEFVHPSAHERASGKASRVAGGTRIRVFAERVDNFLRAEKQ